ncbi:hypothetical protein J7J95_01355 [bacterium]|nr:hypothetical protein [bacterium]
MTEREIPPVEKKPERQGEVPPEVPSFSQGETVQSSASPVVSDDTGQPLLYSVPDEDEVINLPLNQEEIEAGLKEKITEAIKWLAEWCLKMLKIYPDKVISTRS